MIIHLKTHEATLILETAQCLFAVPTKPEENNFIIGITTQGATIPVPFGNIELFNEAKNQLFKL